MPLLYCLFFSERQQCCTKRTEFEICFFFWLMHCICRSESKERKKPALCFEETLTDKFIALLYLWCIQASNANACLLCAALLVSECGVNILTVSIKGFYSI